MIQDRTDQQLIDQLTAASVEIDGQRWVHAARLPGAFGGGCGWCAPRRHSRNYKKQADGHGRQMAAAAVAGRWQ